jgi:hypothetical protein
VTGFAAPGLATSQLHYAFDEDAVTLAWDAVRAANVPHGAALSVDGPDLPAWWWTGTGLRKDVQAGLVLRFVMTSVGPVVVVDDGSRRDPEALAHAALALAPAADSGMLERIRAARESADGEADFPLGAYVLPARHDAVLVERMRLPPGKVLSWTTIGAGAAPSEFIRLQDAVGAYHVVLVDCGGKRTVGIWCGAEAPRTGQAVRPALRRLFRSQGAWRYGVKFSPA